MRAVPIAVRAIGPLVGIADVLLGCAAAGGASDGSADSGAEVSREASDGSSAADALAENDTQGDEGGLRDGATNPEEAGGFNAESDSSSPSDAGLWASVSESGPPAWSGPAVSGSVTVSQTTVAGHLGDGFVGLSYEKSHPVSYTHLDVYKRQDREEGHAFALGTQGIGMFLRGQWREALAKEDIAYAKYVSNRAGWHANGQLFAIWSLTFLGRLEEFRRRHAKLLRDAEGRGDLYTTCLLYTSRIGTTRSRRARS